MKLSGKDIHQAYRRVRPHSYRRWSRISFSAKRLYSELARELNSHLEQDTVTIIAVRCPHCFEMLEVAHAEGHACWGQLDKALSLSFEQIEQNAGPANSEYCWMHKPGGWTCQEPECKGEL